MDQKLFSNIMLLILSIGIHMRYEALGNVSVDTLGKRFHVNFLGYSHWLMSIVISQMKDHSVSVD